MESRGRTPCSETGEAESSQSEFTPLSPSLEDRPDLRDEAGAVCDRTADRLRPWLEGLPRDFFASLPVACWRMGARSL
eukprot:s2399_g8.t1